MTAAGGLPGGENPRLWGGGGRGRDCPFWGGGRVPKIPHPLRDGAPRLQVGSRALAADTGWGRSHGGGRGPPVQGSPAGTPRGRGRRGGAVFGLGGIPAGPPSQAVLGVALEGEAQLGVLGGWVEARGSPGRLGGLRAAPHEPSLLLAQPAQPPPPERRVLLHQPAQPLRRRRGGRGGRRPSLRAGLGALRGGLLGRFLGGRLSLVAVVLRGGGERGWGEMWGGRDIWGRDLRCGGLWVRQSPPRGSLGCRGQPSPAAAG